MWIVLKLWCRMYVMHLWSTPYDKGMYTGERKDYTRSCDGEHTRETEKLALQARTSIQVVYICNDSPSDSRRRP